MAEHLLDNGSHALELVAKDGKKPTIKAIVIYKPPHK
jgi:hypothetical protein